MYHLNRYRKGVVQKCISIHEKNSQQTRNIGTTSFHCTLLYCTSQILSFYKLKASGNPALNKSIGTTSQQYFLIKVCRFFKRHNVIAHNTPQCDVKITFICTGTRKFTWFALLQHLLYRSALGLNPHYHQGLPVQENFPTDKRMQRGSRAGKPCGVNWEEETKMQEKNLQSGISCQGHSLSRSGGIRSIIWHATEVRKDEERDTSREVTGGLEDCRLGAEVNPLLTSHLLFLACLRMTPIPPLRNYANQGFPGGSVIKNPPINAGDTGSIPGPGRSHMPRSN